MLEVVQTRQPEPVERKLIMKEVTKLNIVRFILFVIVGTMAFAMSRSWSNTFGLLCWVYMFGVLSEWLQTAERIDLEEFK